MSVPERMHAHQRPPITDTTSPAFENWAAQITVPEHLANALQLVELLLTTQLCEHEPCPHCTPIRQYAEGIRSRLAAIALRAMPRTPARAIEVPE